MNRMIRAWKKLARGAVLVISSAFASKVVLAQSINGGSGPITLNDPLGGSETFTSVTTAVAGFLFWDIALPLCAIMVLIGAFQMMTSAGDPEKFSKAKNTIMYAAIGFAVALIAGSAATIIKNFVNGS